MPYPTKELRNQTVQWHVSFHDVLSATCSGTLRDSNCPAADTTAWQIRQWSLMPAPHGTSSKQAGDGFHSPLQYKDAMVITKVHMCKTEQRC